MCIWWRATYILLRWNKDCISTRCVDGAEASLLCCRSAQMDTLTTMRRAYKILTGKSDQKRQLGRYGRILLNCNLRGTVSPNTSIYRNALDFYSRRSQSESRARNQIFWYVIVVSACFSRQISRQNLAYAAATSFHILCISSFICQTATHPQILTASRNKRHTKETDYEGVDWIWLAQDTAYWWDLGNTITISGFCIRQEISWWIWHQSLSLSRSPLRRLRRDE
jgi:hypothetical protein